MHTPTAPTKQDIAAENATGNTAFAVRPSAQHAARRRRQVGGSVIPNAGVAIGTAAKASATKNAAQGIGNGNSPFSRLLVASAFHAETMTRASWISTILTPAKRTNRRTGNTQWVFASCFGKRRWEISRSFVRTATGSRRTKRTGGLKTSSSDIACRRIEEAYKQPDMFVSPPAPAPEQLALLEAAE